MVTSNHGSQSIPSHNEGEFVVKYISRGGLWGRRERQKGFTHYDAAKVFYDGIDDSAAIWNMGTTRGPELCEAKDRVAYFSVTLQHKQNAGEVRQMAVTESETWHALAKVYRAIEGTEWSLVRDSCHEVSLIECEKIAY